MFKKADKAKIRTENKGKAYTIGLIITGSVFFGVVLWVFLSSTRSVTAVVPNQEIGAGTTITQGMLKEVQIPANTPSGYITDANSLIGQKSKVEVNKNQLLYNTDVESSFNMFGNDVKIPKNFIVTTINATDENAVSGLISAGDNVDVAGVPTSDYQTLSADAMKQNLGGMAKDNFGASGINGYWVLGNVKILQSYESQENGTTSGSTATQQNANGSKSDSNQSSSNSNVGVKQGSYIVALSYADYKKLLVAQQYLTLYLNISPKSGYNKKLMESGKNLNSLKDAQKQNGNKNLKKKHHKKSNKGQTDQKHSNVEKNNENNKAK